MPLTVAANVIEEIARGYRPGVEQLEQAAMALHELFLASSTMRRTLPLSDLTNAIGLVNHALRGAVPRLSETGRARTLQLAKALRHQADTRRLGDPR